MRQVLIAICVLCLYSCNSQDNSNIEITGNWYNYSNTSSDNLYYVETFISNEKFHYYNEFSGLTPEIKYKIEGKLLYKVSLDNTEKVINGSIEVIDSNTFLIKKGKDVVVFKRINTGIKLEDFLLNDKTEDDYWNGFNKRKEEWEKNKIATD